MRDAKGLGICRPYEGKGRGVRGWGLDGAYHRALFGGKGREYSAVEAEAEWIVEDAEQSAVVEKFQRGFIAKGRLTRKLLNALVVDLGRE
jgi:hypothetical protein